MWYFLYIHIKNYNLSSLFGTVFCIYIKQDMLPITKKFTSPGSKTQPKLSELILSFILHWTTCKGDLFGFISIIYERNGVAAGRGRTGGKRYVTDQINNCCCFFFFKVTPRDQKTLETWGNTVNKEDKIQRGKQGGRVRMRWRWGLVNETPGKLGRGDIKQECPSTRDLNTQLFISSFTYLQFQTSCWTRQMLRSRVLLNLNLKNSSLEMGRGFFF